MKKLLVLILTVCSIEGYGQTIMNPSASNSPTNINDAISKSAVASGTDTYTATIIGATYTTTKAYSFTFTNACTGTPTPSININNGTSNLGAITLKKFNSSGSLVNLTAGDIWNGDTKRFSYNGTNFVMEGGSGSGGGGDLLAANNLSDLASALTARTNLGLGTAALISSTAGGDLSGTLPSPTVAKINGNTVPANASGVLTNNGSGTLTWATPSGSGTVNSGTANQLAYYAGTGTALSGTNAIPNGTTATTQSALDNSTKVATTAYANAAVTAAALPAADATHDGYLTQTDWSTFNGKISANQTISFSPTGDVTGSTTGSTTLAPVFAIGAGKVTNTMIAASTIDLTAKVTGILPVANGGNGVSTGAYLQASGGTASGPNVFNGTATNNHIFKYSGTIGSSVTTPPTLFSIENTNAATLGAQEESSILLRARGFATGVGASQTNDWKITNLPVQGSLLNSSLLFLNSVNGVNFSTVFTINGSGASAPSYGFTSGASISSAANKMTVQAANSSSIGLEFLQAYSSTTTNGVALDWVQGFAPTSGSTTWKGQRISGTINQTGGANGATTMIDVIPTLTSAVGTHTFLHYKPTETSVGTHYFISDGSTGLVGLGTETPTAKLHVVGTVKLDGSVTLPTVGNKISIKEGSGGYMGQSTLVSGTKAITVSGVTTSTRCFLTRVVPSGTTLTTDYDCVCTANTVTIQADVAAGTINTADGSTFNYMLFEPAP